jgi:hypothetical protein
MLRTLTLCMAPFMHACAARLNGAACGGYDDFLAKMINSVKLNHLPFGQLEPLPSEQFITGYFLGGVICHRKLFVQPLWILRTGSISAHAFSETATGSLLNPVAFIYRSLPTLAWSVGA